MSRKLFSLREKVVQHLTSPVSFAVRAAVNLGHVRLFFESLQRCGNTRWRNESRAPDAPKCRCSARRWQRSDVFRSASIQCRRARARCIHIHLHAVFGHGSHVDLTVRPCLCARVTLLNRQVAYARGDSFVRAVFLAALELLSLVRAREEFISFFGRNVGCRIFDVLPA